MGMENPLVGSFNRERTALTFHQRSLEVNASYLAMAGGVFMFLIGVAKSLGLVLPLPLDPIWWVFFGLAFAASGLWAYLLFRQLRFDLRKRIYNERFGTGALVRWRKGSTDEVRCLELARFQGLLPTGRSASPQGAWGGMPNPNAVAPITPGTLLVVRLWWNDPHRAPLVIEHLIAGAGYGVQDQQVRHFVGLAQGYAQSLRVPLVGSL